MTPHSTAEPAEAARDRERDRVAWNLPLRRPDRADDPEHAPETADLEEDRGSSPAKEDDRG